VTRLLAALALCAVLPRPVEATTVVILITPHRIVVAADSRQSDGVTISNDGCKIRLGASKAVAFSGKLTSIILNKGTEVVTAAGSVAHAYVTFLRRLADEESYPFPGEGFAVAFVAFENGRPALAANEIKPPIPWKEAKTCKPGTDCTSSPVLGEKSAIDSDALLAWLKTAPTKKAMIERARAAVRQQANAPGMTDKVGGPIDIALIDAKGVRWVQVKDGCR
jgi:hypothetical protein